MHAWFEGPALAGTQRHYGGQVGLAMRRSCCMPCGGPCSRQLGCHTRHEGCTALGYASSLGQPARRSLRGRLCFRALLSGLLQSPASTGSALSLRVGFWVCCVQGHAAPHPGRHVPEDAPAALSAGGAAGLHAPYCRCPCPARCPDPARTRQAASKGDASAPPCR